MTGVPHKITPHLGEVRRDVIRAIFARRRLRQVVFRYADWRDWLRPRPSEYASTPLPPASLRFRVHGDLHPDSFLETGRQCSDDIRAALATLGRDLRSFEHVLDFGCGCGRTLLWFRDAARATQFSGTDIDATAIDWCRRHIDFANFSTNDPTPPSPYPNNSFDLIYAISVFTHLDERRQLEWLDELRRLTKPGGYALVTVRGSLQRAMMSPQELEQLRETGFHFSQMPNKSMSGIFPEWYQTATHTREYVQSIYSTYFDVVDYLPKSLDQSQDIVILRKS